MNIHPYNQTFTHCNSQSDYSTWSFSAILMGSRGGTLPFSTSWSEARSKRIFLLAWSPLP
eukprot:2883101-Amphidinium_carterae.1